MPFTLDNILAATGGRLAQVGPCPTDALSIEIDSRKVSGPSVFWALPGERFDGHDFVSQSVEQGATVCVVQAGRWAQLPQQIAVVEVTDTLRALGDLARWHRQRLKARVIGITGSFGKTTTRELVASVLAARFRVFQSQKNFNNDIGLPLCLFELQADHDVAVLELGASAIGDIRRLCSVARPELGIITGIGRAHSGSFGGVQKTREAKAELVACLPANGRAFLPSDDAERDFLASRSACAVTWVGTDAAHSPDVLAEGVVAHSGRVGFSVGASRFEFAAAGPHFVRNALFAVAVGREFGLSDHEIAAGLAQFQPVAGRCQIKTLKGVTVIDDTYNASPETLVAACRTLGQWQTSGRRILVTGDMLALGDDAIAGHQEVGTAAAAAHVDLLLSLGEYSRVVVATAQQAGLASDQAATFQDLDPLLQRLAAELHDGDVVLVKGSRGMRMERVIDWLAERKSVSAVGCP